MEDIVALFESRMSVFEKSLVQSQTTTKNTSTGSDISALAADYTVFKDLMWKSLSMLRQQLQLLTAGFDRHEMLSRRKVLLFHGLPEDSDEQTESKVLTDLQLKHQLSQRSHISGLLKKAKKKLPTKLGTLNIEFIISCLVLEQQHMSS
ncbi:unnamed protein product, partial [Brenthis ino]